MTGLIINHLGREYKIASKEKIGIDFIASLISHRDEFVLEGGRGEIASFQKIRDGLDIEVEIASLNESELSPLITEDNDTSEIGYEYSKMVEERDSEWEWNQKLNRFYALEKVLKEEGLI